MARFSVPSLMLVAVVCSGCFPLPEKSEQDEKKTEKPKPSLAADLDKIAGGNGKQPKFQEHRVAAKRGNLGVLTNQLYNYREIIKKRPKLKVRTKATGGTVLTSAALSATSRASKAQFDRMIQIMKIDMNRGWPSYNAVLKQMQQTGLKLAKLTPYQVYAYDEKTGQLFILEDSEMKAKLYSR
ncbi:MAG: hypothetical protein ACE5KM_03755 [Planctomycetaceae bacterium]